MNLILGYIGENINTLKETENFIRVVSPQIMQTSFIIAMNGTEFTQIAIEKNWINNNISWQEKITDLKLEKDRYKPFQLDLFKEMKNLYKVLYLNPKWWFNGIKTLVKNPQLILPIMGAIVNRSKSINII